MADYTAGATFHTAFVAKEYAAIGHWSVASGWTTVDTLLTLALETDVLIDNPDVRSRRVDDI